MRIRKAVIPAAGIGSRFLPITKALPKEMLPIVDTPAIQFVIEEAVAAGIDHILVITNGSKQMIEDYFDASPALEMVLEGQGKHELQKLVHDISHLVNIHFVRQKEPLGLGHALLCAQHFVGEEPFAVLLPDEVVFSKLSSIGEMAKIYGQFATSVIGVQEVEANEVDRYGIVSKNHAVNVGVRGVHQIHRLVEKPKMGAVASNLAIIGRYILEPEIFDVLQSTPPGVSGEIQLTDALSVLNQRRPALAWEIVGKRYDLGNKLGYLQASIDYALERKDLSYEMVSYLRSKSESRIREEIQ